MGTLEDLRDKNTHEHNEIVEFVVKQNDYGNKITALEREIAILKEKEEKSEKARDTGNLWIRTFVPLVITALIGLFSYFTIELGEIDSELAGREVRIARNTMQHDEQQALDLDQDRAITDVYKKLEADNLDLYDRIAAMSERIAKLEAKIEIMNKQ